MYEDDHSVSRKHDVWRAWQISLMKREPMSSSMQG
jgi:hypothetical protein